MKIVKRNGEEWERYVMAELLVPDTLNVYGDLWSREGIRNFAEEFAIQGHIIDVNHDEVDVSGKLVIVEKFIAREGDPDFIEGSYVIGMKILDDALWQRVLAGDLNGFSYQMVADQELFIMENLTPRTIHGTTEPDPIDGHVHSFVVTLDSLNRPIQGGTGITDGHSHYIQVNSVTGISNSHLHRYHIN